MSQRLKVVLQTEWHYGPEKQVEIILRKTLESIREIHIYLVSAEVEKS